VPVVRPEDGKRIMSALEEAIRRGFVAAAHDCSEGGIGVALAEMAIGGRLGFDVRLEDVPLGDADLGDSAILFAESNGRFVVEVRAEDQAAFENVVDGLPAAPIGRVTDDGYGRAKGLAGGELFALPVQQMVERWKGGLQW